MDHSLPLARFLMVHYSGNAAGMGNATLHCTQETAVPLFAAYNAAQRNVSHFCCSIA